jgi:hypothetical protein
MLRILSIMLTLSGQSKGMERMNDMTLNYHLMHPGGDSMPGGLELRRYQYDIRHRRFRF